MTPQAAQTDADRASRLAGYYSEIAKRLGTRNVIRDVLRSAFTKAVVDVGALTGTETLITTAAAARIEQPEAFDTDTEAQISAVAEIAEADDDSKATDTAGQPASPVDEYRRADALLAEQMLSGFEYEVMYGWPIMYMRRDKSRTVAPLFLLPVQGEHTATHLNVDRNGPVRLNLPVLLTLISDSDAVAEHRLKAHAEQLASDGPLTLHDALDLLKDLELHLDLTLPDDLADRTLRPLRPLPERADERMVLLPSAVLFRVRRGNYFTASDLQVIGDRAEELLGDQAQASVAQFAFSERPPDRPELTDALAEMHSLVAPDVVFPLPASAPQRQIAVALNHGAQLVAVDGPPGTGKSHTITNLICHLVSQGKSVLVASEKHEALRVVNDKLGSVGTLPFHVSLLGDTPDARRHFRDQIQAINGVASTVSRTSGQVEQQLRERHNALAAQLSQLDDVLRQSIAHDSEVVPVIHELRDLGEFDIWAPGELPLTDRDSVDRWAHDQLLGVLARIAGSAQLWSCLGQWRLAYPDIAMQQVLDYAQVRRRHAEVNARTDSFPHAAERSRWLETLPEHDADALAEALALQAELREARRDAERQQVPAELLAWYTTHPDIAPQTVLQSGYARRQLRAHLQRADESLRPALELLASSGASAADLSSAREQFDRWTAVHAALDPLTRKLLERRQAGEDVRGHLQQLDQFAAFTGQLAALQQQQRDQQTQYERQQSEAQARLDRLQEIATECDRLLAELDESPDGPVGQLDDAALDQAAEQVDRALVHLPAPPPLTFPIHITDDQLDDVEVAITDLQQAGGLSRRRREAKRVLTLAVPAAADSKTQAAAIAEAGAFCRWRRSYLARRSQLLSDLEGLIHPQAAHAADPDTLTHELNVLKGKLAAEARRRAERETRRRTLADRKQQAVAGAQQLREWQQQAAAFRSAQSAEHQERITAMQQQLEQLRHLATELGIADGDGVPDTRPAYRALERVEQVLADQPDPQPLTTLAGLPSCGWLAGPRRPTDYLDNWPQFSALAAFTAQALALAERQSAGADAPIDVDAPDALSLLHTAHRVAVAERAARAHPLERAAAAVPYPDADASLQDLQHQVRLLGEARRLQGALAEHPARHAAEQLARLLVSEHLCAHDVLTGDQQLLLAAAELDRDRQRLSDAPAAVRGTVAGLVDRAAGGRAFTETDWQQALRVADLRAELEQADRRAAARPNQVADQARSLNRQLTATARELVDASVQARLAGLRASDARRELQTLSQTVAGRKNKHARLRAFDTLRHEFDWTALLKVVPVWLLSLEDTSRLTDMEPGLFDVVIIDEASQCTIPQGVPTLLRGKQALVFGDERQLRPVTTGFLNPGTNQELKRRFGVDELKYHAVLDAKDRSLLDMCKARCELPTTLDEHFRCQPPIIDYCRMKFYAGDGNRLGFRIMTDNRRSPLGVPALAAVRVDVPQTADAQGPNRAEADALVLALKQELAKPEWENVTVGVLSPFRDQVGLIQGLLTVHLSPAQIKQHRIVVSTFDGFQGNERDVIFYSLRNTDQHPLQGLSTMSAEKVNVGLSRARYHARTFYSLSPERAGQLREWILYSQDPNAGVPETLEDKFDSNFEREVCYALRDQGLTVTTQVRSCGYRIDLVVNDGDRQLAVECDGMYWHAKEPGSDELKDSDLYRQDVLERAGWRVFRISDKEWAQDPDRCVREAIAALKAPVAVAA